ncbi:protein Mpv17 [Ricinus communis]|uniref:protein Mpv17 n=1 Tax=Ricinus communis TaxID=3988 RepID=UPI00077231C2|nr:protein Mpv17 [Ricinus communis]|eukprot:XP_015571717.1 protein Mpv17 [Ricinus communis]
MLKLWKWYQQCLSTHPVKTQIVSSGFLWSIGDIGAQYITHSTAVSRHKKSDAEAEFKINWKRVAITGLFGFGFIGPLGHYWYEGLDKIMRLRFQLPPKSLRFVAAKVAADTLIFAPFDLFVFFTYMGLASGKSVAQVKEDVRRDFLPAMIMEGSIWPIVQVANFRYVPVRHQLLYVNTFCLLDSAFLSWFEQQNDAPWKQWFTSVKPLKEREGQGQGRL